MRKQYRPRHVCILCARDLVMYNKIKPHDRHSVKLTKRLFKLWSNGAPDWCLSIVHNVPLDDVIASVKYHKRKDIYKP